MNHRVAAAILGLLLFACAPAQSFRERLLASSDTRPTPGRVAGESTYRPWRTRDLAVAFRQTAVRPSDELTLPDRSLLDLLLGETDRAIAGFELAARDEALAPDALTDLSAAYLVRYESTGDCLDLLRSVDAAERGLVLQPSSGALKFNRAQALSRLGTRIIAKRALSELATGADGWHREARERLRELARPGVENEWNAVLPRLERSQSASDIRSITDRFPGNARVFAEEVLLPRWAAEVERGATERAHRSLFLASAIGETLRARGETLLTDSIRAAKTTKEREALLRGLQAFGEGVRHYHDQNLDSAAAPLSRAATDLARAGVPLHLWARFYLAVGEYFEDASRGLVTLNRLLAATPQDEYLALTGRIEWIAGTVDKIQGRLQSALRRHERSAASLRRAGGESAAAYVLVLLAESYTALGEHSLAWQTRKNAFRTVPVSEGFRRTIAMWTEAKEALVRQGQLRLARPFVDEAVANAELWATPLGLASAHLDHAEHAIETGEEDVARHDLDRAKSAIARMEPSPLREQMTLIADITEGLCSRKSNPGRAAVLLRRALTAQAARGSHFETITYATAMADAQIASGDVVGCVATLENVLEMFEDIRVTVEDPVSRMQAFRQAQPAFDRLLDIRTTSAEDDRDESFLLAERSRARVLLDVRQGQRNRGVDDGAVVRLADVERGLPPDLALASYIVLERRVVVWIVEDGRARRLSIPISRPQLEEAIERFRLEMRRSASVPQIRSAAAPLYDILIRPLALPARPRSLVIIPDRWLSRLPFPALFDRRAGRYLIEQHSIAMTPSATILMRGSRPEKRDAAASAVVFSVSRGGAYHGRLLPRLPDASREATAVAKAYPASLLLQDAQATRENFLREALQHDVVHFAGHTVMDLEAPRRSVMLFAGKGGVLDPLSLEELLDAGSSRTSLVALSTCRAQDSLADDRESVLGLAGAFLAVGVHEVVASPWEVDDRLAVPIMSAFHRHYRTTRSAARAYRLAVLEQLRAGTAEQRSPAAWGGFTVITGSVEK